MGNEIIKEKWIIEFFIFSPEKTALNIKGEQSQKYLVDDDGKFYFNSYNEAKEVLEASLIKLNSEDYIPRVYEIKKVYIQYKHIKKTP